MRPMTAANASKKPRRAGFTLVELLIVVAILGILMGMLMPMYGVIVESMRRSRTAHVIKKTDACLRLFKADWGVYPHQASYPDPIPASGFPNRLYYHLGTAIDWTPTAGPGSSPAERVKQDMEAAAAQYNDASPTAITFRATDIQSSDPTDRSAFNAAKLNRMAQEQARLGVLGGNLGLRGPVIANITTGATVTDRRASQLLSSPRSAASPGWANDYLAGELEAKYISGEAILDAWGKPLIYIHQAVPGIKAANPPSGYTISRNAYGLGPLGFDSTTGPADAVVALGRAQLLCTGRIRLEPTTTDGKPLPDLPPWLPSAAVRLESDVRYFAADGFECEFELWSAGRDRRFAYMRNDAANRDNLPAGPYNRALMP